MRNRCKNRQIEKRPSEKVQYNSVEQNEGAKSGWDRHTNAQIVQVPYFSSSSLNSACDSRWYSWVCARSPRVSICWIRINAKHGIPIISIAAKKNNSTPPSSRVKKSTSYAQRIMNKQAYIGRISSLSSFFDFDWTNFNEKQTTTIYWKHYDGKFNNCFMFETRSMSRATFRKYKKKMKIKCKRWK